jgi:hypothetical protein
VTARRAAGLRAALIGVALSTGLPASSDAEAEPYDAGPSIAAPSAEGPWADGIALPAWATTVRVIRSDEFILNEPTKSASRRGSAAREARLPLFGARGGAGCRNPWYSVGPNAWICGDEVELSRGTSIPASARTFEPSSDGLPYRYYFVGPDGTQGYRKLREVDISQADVQLDPGFAVAVVEERSFEGQRYGMSGNDLWVPMRDLSPTRPFSFQGAEIPASTDNAIKLGWVVAEGVRVFSGPSGARITGESLAKFVRVDILEESGTFEKFVRIGENRWARSKDIRRPTTSAPPDEIDVAAGERWVDVELSTQTLVAYEGVTPKFATLISSGKGKGNASNATPKGNHRIWVKLAASNMDNLEDEGANRFYRMESVPYVQYFSKGVGLHGAYWHRGFGNVRSHGCVNLAPLDAQRLFWFTSPRLPAGWTAVLPNERERGSLVRVR